MGLNSLIFWYQKKIGTYDKQQWEKTIEQRIFGGFTHVPMRAAKLKTEFIDVDLVRGSSFPKAKPKHGFSTVAYLAVKRLLFLPVQYQWWIQQTSTYIFLFFLLLYLLQIYSVALYYIQTSQNHESDIISFSEILIPLFMMLTLSVIHSQIVSTHSGTNATCNGDEKRPRSARSKLGRYRFKKSRHARNLSDNKNVSDASQQSNNCIEISPSVRFAKKVIIESFTNNVTTQQHISNPQDKIETTSQSHMNVLPEVENDEEKLNDEAQHEIADPVPQDDDGFESLNGNDASSDDRENVVVESKAEQTKSDSVPSTSKVNNFCEEKRDAENSSSRESPLQCDSEEEGECEENATNHLTEATTSATEWMGVTTNSDDCSYSSEFEGPETHNEGSFNYSGDLLEHPFSWEFEIPPSSSSCTSSDRVSCTIWTRREIKKAKLSVLDISSAIIARVESMPESMDYFYGGLILAIVLSLVPSIRRLNDHFNVDSAINSTNLLISANLTLTNVEPYSELIIKLINVAFGTTLWERSIILISAFERLVLSFLIFFLLAVAERTYKQRLLYAKLFSHLTSSRRARKSDLPHFRLNKVQNIRTWLSIRSYLKRRGPQRSVDVIVSSIFIVTLLLLSFVSLELIKDLDSLQLQYNVEALFWSFAFGMFILRFMTLGTKINKKYRNLSILITEQINLYLQIEQKPHKKDELMVANSVLKLAADLIKELENPFKISGLSDNPYLYTITKVVLLSALSGVLSELLGFKLKLHKIKIK